MPSHELLLESFCCCLLSTKRNLSQHLLNLQSFSSKQLLDQFRKAIVLFGWDSSKWSLLSFQQYCVTLRGMESLERSCFSVVRCFVYCKQRVNSMTSKLEISGKINQKSRVVKSYRKLAPFSAITSRFPLIWLLSFYVDSRF